MSPLRKKLQTLTMSVITLYFGKCNVYFWLHEAFECVMSELISPKQPILDTCKTSRLAPLEEWFSRPE